VPGVDGLDARTFMGGVPQPRRLSLRRPRSATAGSDCQMAQNMTSFTQQMRQSAYATARAGHASQSEKTCAGSLNLGGSPRGRGAVRERLNRVSSSSAFSLASKRPPLQTNMDKMDPNGPPLVGSIGTTSFRFVRNTLDPTASLLNKSFSFATTPHSTLLKLRRPSSGSGSGTTTRTIPHDKERERTDREREREKEKERTDREQSVSTKLKSWGLSSKGLS